MGSRPSPEASAVADAFRHLDVDVDVDGQRIRHLATGQVIEIHLGEPGPGSGPQIVVRDRVTPAARRRFQDDGIGWLDLGGHLSVRSPALVIEADVPGQPGLATQRRTFVLAGAVVSGVTMAALSAWPDPLNGVRATARAIDATPAGVSYALKRIAAAGYMTSDHRANAELFWAAASEWRPSWIEVPVSALPSRSEAVAVGGLAAASIGAPIAVMDATAPEYLVASSAVIQYAVMSASADSGDPGLVARCAVAPAPIATRSLHPLGRHVHGVPVASEAIVALSLAIDPARGAETVSSWEGDHVWS